MIKIVQVGVGVRGGQWARVIQEAPAATAVAYVDLRFSGSEGALDGNGVPCYNDLAQALDEILGPRIKTGVIAVNERPPDDLEHIRVLEAGHPVPSQRSYQAAREVMACAQSAGSDDLVFVAVLLDEAGGVVDELRGPVDGLYPTGNWQQGEIVRDQYAFWLDKSMMPGRYGLELRVLGVSLPLTEIETRRGDG